MEPRTENHDVFNHVAYEAHEDLLLGVRSLVPLVLERDERRLLRAWTELLRESFERASRPHPLDADEVTRTRARLVAVGADEVDLPEVAPQRAWRGFLRRLARLERMIELKGPEIVIQDFREGLREAARLGWVPQPYVPPQKVEWARPSDFVVDAVHLAGVTMDDVGLGRAVNRLPEVTAFFERYPDAYSYWDIHSSVPEGEDPDRPEPERLPAPLWTAKAVTFSSFVAESNGAPIPYGFDGPASFGSTTTRDLHPDLARACARAAERGLVVIGYIAVEP